jgi:cyclopropane-fatty-acyl-phospholipid synthase
MLLEYLQVCNDWLPLPSCLGDEIAPARKGKTMVPQALWTILPARSAFDLLAKIFRAAVQYGSLTMIDPWGEGHIFGTGDPPFVTVHINDPHEPARLLANPSLRVGEAYMDGTLVITRGTLRDFLSICVAAATNISQQASVLPDLSGALRRLRHENPIARARANVEHHYDISEELYRLFLDNDLQYSCAYFQNGDESLEEAQAKKLRHLAAKLRLKPGHRVLDIGSGWGGMALDFARRDDVNVDGLTLSSEQLRVATARTDSAGLNDQVRFHLRDYRHEQGVYDRIVSVGMFEHVGAAHHDEFFKVIGRLLAPDGIAVIHAIGCKDTSAGINPWIDRYIFPGGYCPPLSEVLTAVEKSGLWVTDVEVLRLHYAETLYHWYQRFQASRERAVELYSERFCRMWEFYLASCEAGFRVGSLMVFQIQLARKIATLPVTRDYMFDNERQSARVRLKTRRQDAVPAEVAVECLV